ncbi:efflux RND transporter periplasmic adaptor subunit [Myxococcus xanthus]|uniref:Efflux transporter periplasmic adaptor subunit n=1 Tax=Myxococcus xanthus TaxID=34 RepID=A0AAE6G8D5_MYXXA|nr:efflux RND transporter periplasmic adaptor subunit [Myxococcus xanthus]QDE72509.1 efflux transporter periplasmic adaptor subunit [Myxococcus xanthus]QDE79792.1 efflux transporter periplasmic adaptor subunit [Myxococcus xanthus]QDE87148.1 efflux transporter periplasmic adaptor subunit [Myxococcus xanthus]QDF05458.1 efflux transporter periplasmic adaptor subunit [Myxococcus xanthus]
MRRAGTLGLAVAALALGVGCKKDAQSAQGGAAPAGGGRAAIQFPVEVAPVESRDVEYVVDAVGSVEAFERVQITARVPGAVERVLFAEGQSVKKGAVLAEIEPARYAIAVRSAEATLARARATLVEAEAGAKRRTAVNEVSPGLLPAEQLETFEARARTAEADVAAAKALLDQAQLNQRDAYVRAPMDGVLQTRTVQTGQYVQPGIVLATLLRREPLLLRFTVPAADVSRIQPGMTARFSAQAAGGGSFTAKITHVAAAADDASRMVPVTAEVTGEDAERLRPGAFATVAVPVDTRGGSPVIPQTAVRASERGFLAYVVEGNKARERVLELGLRTADGRVEVRDGVKPGEMLVVRGGEALRDGANVRVAEGPKPTFTGEPRLEPEAASGGGGARQ